MAGATCAAELETLLPPTPCPPATPPPASRPPGRPRGLARRVIACLDVRANDNGDLVVTKGDQYDVRESSGESSGEVRARQGGAGGAAGRGATGWG